MTTESFRHDYTLNYMLDEDNKIYVSIDDMIHYFESMGETSPLLMSLGEDGGKAVRIAKEGIQRSMALAAADTDMVN